MSALLTPAAVPPMQRRDRCALLLSHRLSGVTLTNFAAVRATMGATHDVFLALTEPLAEEAHALGLAGQFVILDKADIFVPAYHRKSTHQRIVPGNPDLAMLAFWRAHPGYAAYWLLEYDVLMPRGYAALGEICMGSHADLLASRVRTYTERPDWGHWRTLARPDGPVPELERHAALMSLARFSQPLMVELHRAYGSGWRGHHECAVPTIARQAGLLVTELNVEAKTVLGRPIMSPQGFRVKDCEPTQPDFAHHPVKTEDEARRICQALGIEQPAPPSPANAAAAEPPHQPGHAGSNLELLAALEEANAHLSLACHHLADADPAIPAALRGLQGDVAQISLMLQGDAAPGPEIALPPPGPSAAPATPPVGLAASHVYLAAAIARRAAAIGLRPGTESRRSLPPDMARYVSLLPDHLHAQARRLDAPHRKADGPLAADGF